MSENQDPFLIFMKRYMDRQIKVLDSLNLVGSSVGKLFQELHKGEPSNKKIRIALEHAETMLANDIFSRKSIQDKTAIKKLLPRISLLSITLRRQSKEDLASRLSEATYENELLWEEIEALLSVVVYLSDALSTIRVHEISVDTNRQQKKRVKEKLNEDCLKICLQRFKEEMGRDVISSDFLKFSRFVIKLHPNPPYIKEVRLTPEEKKMPEPLRIEILEDKRNAGWKDGYIRKFWEKHTNFKASTKNFIT